MDQDLKMKLKHYKITEGELERIKGLLGREPRSVEWALFSALWNEHCSYKSSKVHLKKFFGKNERVMQSFGENAGVINLGEGEKVAFKMESHNHPSFIEPYQGAATGVGGILRDIFTMGARPIALADYLCFGELSAPRMRTLVDGVVRGISGYGNCVGVPTITGQTEFHSSYNKNILVNAMAVGYFGPNDPIVTSRAGGLGNCIVYVGAKTGKDGVHGATMASESFGDNQESKKPNVQIGDPFYEKLLIEACLEVMKADLVVAIQDMGAAGLTSSSFEMSAKGGVGFKMHLDQVPLRDSTLTPEEILLSESQERMLLVCEPSKLKAVCEVFERWGIDAKQIGEVTKGPNVELFWRGELLTSIDPKILVDQAPQYERPYERWSPKNRAEQVSQLKVKVNSGEEIKVKLSELMGAPATTSREWIYRQYDQRVGIRTARDAEESVAVQRLPSGRALGVVLGCRPHVMRFDAFVGGMDAVAYPALELSAKGFEPLAVTDCLNFGSPEDPKIMSEFVASVEAMSMICEKLNAPVISGNVSFYNQTNGVNITSTPATGLVGLKSSIDNVPYSHFRKWGEKIYVLSIPMLRLSGKMAEDQSMIVQGVGEVLHEGVTTLCRVVRGGVEKGWIKSSRVVGQYGLAYALAKMCVKGVGARIDNWKEVAWDGRPETLLMESLYQIVLSVDGQTESDFVQQMIGGALAFNARRMPGQDAAARLHKIGETGGDVLKFADLFEMPVMDLSLKYQKSLGEQLEVMA